MDFLLTSCVLALIAIFVYALFKKVISGIILATLILTIVFSGIFVHNRNQFQKTDSKEEGVEMSAEMIKIRADVYAKAEEIKKMGGEIGHIASFAAIYSGRLASDAPVDSLIFRRDRIISMMKDFGADPEKIEGVADEMNQWIIHDLKQSELCPALSEVTHDDKKAKSLMENYQSGVTDRKILAYLSSVSADPAKVVKSIHRLNTFLKDKKLSGL